MQSGRVLTHPAVARQRFREIAELPEPHIDLVEASLVIALEDRPGLEISHYLDEVQAWSGVVRNRLEGSRDVERIVDSINRMLFDEEGFHGEDEDYYDPRSALLNELLDTHAGTPITLSILYLELTRRVGVEAVGVSLPGRFLVKFSGDFGQIFVDPFEGGRVLTTMELQGLLDQIYGGGVRLREHHLRSFSAKDILGTAVQIVTTIAATIAFIAFPFSAFRTTACFFDWAAIAPRTCGSRPFENLDVGLGVAGNVRGDREGLAIVGDLDLLRVQNLAVDLVRQLDGAIAHAPAGSGITRRQIRPLRRVVFPIELDALRRLLGRIDEGETAVVEGFDLHLIGRVDLLGNALPRAGKP